MTLAVADRVEVLLSGAQHEGFSCSDRAHDVLARRLDMGAHGGFGPGAVALTDRGKDRAVLLVDAACRSSPKAMNQKRSERSCSMVRMSAITAVWAASGISRWKARSRFISFFAVAGTDERAGGGQQFLHTHDIVPRHAFDSETTQCRSLTRRAWRILSTPSSEIDCTTTPLREIFSRRPANIRQSSAWCTGVRPIFSCRLICASSR